MRTTSRELCRIAALACVTGACALLAQEKPDLSRAPTLPEILVDADGTVHWGPRTISPAQMISAEARRVYADEISQRFRASAKRSSDPAERAKAELNTIRELIAASRQAALEVFPVKHEEQKIGGVAVSVFTPTDLPAKNRDKIALEFEVDSEAVMVASLGQMKVMSVHYRLAPSLAANEDIVAVYREILKTYKPKNIALFGTSGGCALAQTTTLWLTQLKLPLPGAIGLLTCAGGSSPGDSRLTNNGLDPLLSSAFSGRAPFGGPGREQAPQKPGEPPRSALDGDIPKGYPPAFLLSGTRDMCLSETVLLDRKLRHAGVATDLNIFEGMWHGFHGNPDLPESREAMTALARFFSDHLGK